MKMEQQQINLAIEYGLKMFRDSKNRAPLTDIDGALFLRQLLLSVQAGTMRVITLTPEKPKDVETPADDPKVPE